MREFELARTTNETDISLWLNIDGSGKSEIDTGCGFLNHMLTLFAKHSRIDLKVTCKGDTDIDYHHTAEDIAIVLGTAIKNAIGDKSGINRYGNIILPMDEALILAAVDFSGRSYLVFDCEIPCPTVGDFDTELVEEFFVAFVRTAEINLHIKKLAGKNTHHIIEGIFKAVARCIGSALKIDPALEGEIPSTKGIL